jgi:hypothetical protein
MASDTRSSWHLIAQAVTAALLTFALSLPLMRSSGEIHGVGSSRGSLTIPMAAALGVILNGTTGVIGNVKGLLLLA